MKIPHYLVFVGWQQIELLKKKKKKMKRNLSNSTHTVFLLRKNYQEPHSVSSGVTITARKNKQADLDSIPHIPVVLPMTLVEPGPKL